MKNIIKKLLRENLNDFEDKLFDEGKKFYPKLRFIKVKDKYSNKENLRAFTNYPKNKGSYSLGSFKNAIAVFKIRKTIDWLKDKGISELNFSKSTNSVYFTYKKKTFRISDHKRNDFNGTSIIINWNTTPEEIVNILNNEEYN